MQRVVVIVLTGPLSIEGVVSVAEQNAYLESFRYLVRLLLGPGLFCRTHFGVGCRVVRLMSRVVQDECRVYMTILTNKALS